MAKAVIEKERCKGCFYCIGVCPTKSITQSKETNKKGYQYAEFSGGKCTGCGLCYVFCPEACVEVKKDE